jgi:hypothetical protein
MGASALSGMQVIDGESKHFQTVFLFQNLGTFENNLNPVTIFCLFEFQMIQRILIIFMPQKYQPDYKFLRHVPLTKVYLYTGIQIVCLASLWAVKSVKSISIVFPIMVCLFNIVFEVYQ